MNTLERSFIGGLAEMSLLFDSIALSDIRTQSICAARRQLLSYRLVTGILRWHPICCESTRRDKRHLQEKRMSEENSTGNNLIWAVTLIIIVAILAGALYYSGFLSGNKKQEVDVEIKVPAATR